MILLHGTGAYNKGAELMAIAVLEHFRSRPQPPEFAVPASFGCYRDRARYGLWTVLSEHGLGRSRLITLLAHRGFRQKYGLVAESEISAIVDASGFAFSDQWGVRPTRNMAERCRRWKRQGKKIVLLPQAFGPFSSTSIRNACRELVDHCDLVFAREKSSFCHLTDVVGNRPNIRLAPDFTISLRGRLPEGFTLSGHSAFIVPNQRMLDKPEPKVRESYLPALGRTIDAVSDLGLRPRVLLHAPEDRSLAEQLTGLAHAPFEVLSESSPLALKAMLGLGRLVVGSRFHALVGALSQGVPTLALGWSHKYQELFRDFDCPECVLSVDDLADLPSRIASLAEGPSREDLIRRLCLATERHCQAVAAMWEVVDSVLQA